MKISPKLIEQNLEKIFKIKKKLKTLRYIKQKQYINDGVTQRAWKKICRSNSQKHNC